MSTWVYVYSVPIERLRAAPGSKDRVVIEALGQVEGLLQQIDAIAANRDLDEDLPPKCSETFTQIVNGAPLSTAENDRYVCGHAFQALCAILGDEMERRWAQIARADEWFREIGDALAKLGIGLEIKHLVYRGPLISIPEPDRPTLGYWPVEETASAASAFDQNTCNMADLLGDDLMAAVDDIHSRVKAAHQTGSWLIGAQY